MLSDITFGQYYPADSVVHKLDPRVKILLTTAFIVLSFVAKTAPAVLLTALFMGVLIVLSRIPFKMYLKTLKAIIPVIVLTSLINALYASSGVELFRIFSLSITSGGLMTAVFMSVRICLLILCSSMLTYTTTPTVLTDAIERLLSPLKVLRLDVHSLAMMMTIAMRFIPTLIEETEKIMAAQKARGADLESGGLTSRIKSLIPILIPLLISSFRRASELADAMECRCYQGGTGRTRMKQLHVATGDILSFVLFGVMFVAVILCNTYWSVDVFALLLGGDV
jgi:energy-coupling factor transport system permease protein